MVTITDAAVEKAKEVLKTEGKPEWGIKLFMSGSGCCGPSFGMDLQEEAQDGDTTIEKGDLKFFVNQESVDGLKGMTMDFIEQDDQQGFVIRGEEPPSCSCPSGSSGSGGTCGQ